MTWDRLAQRKGKYCSIRPMECAEYLVEWKVFAFPVTLVSVYMSARVSGYCRILVHLWSVWYRLCRLREPNTNITVWRNISDQQSAYHVKDEIGKDPETIGSNFEILKRNVGVYTLCPAYLHKSEDQSSIQTKGTSTWNRLCLKMTVAEWSKRRCCFFKLTLVVKIISFERG